jgi:hypothetical protein
MTTTDTIKTELSDHIPSTAGDATPDAVAKTVQGGVIGELDEVPASVVGDVVLQKIEGANGNVIAWESMAPEELAAQITRIDDTTNDVGELDVFSDTYLTQWRNEGRSV